jgi:uncharacterized protein (TIGR02145 family)
MFTKFVQIIVRSLTAFMLVLAVGCSGDDNSTNPDNKTVPVLTTAAVSAITETTAQCGGTVTSAGGEAVMARGVCWSTSPTPTVAGSKTDDGMGTGSFTSSITGLTAATPYYVRAYATNSVGTGYGGIKTFQTESSGTGTVTDIDGNVYKTVRIGSQWWMAENLRVTHYRDGTKCPTVTSGAHLWMAENLRMTRYLIGEAIPNVTDDIAWSALSSGAYCHYNNDEGNVDTYGELYNWYAAADSREIAPVGWHMPSDAEWQTLVAYLGGESVAGGELKEAGITHWVSPNTDATNGSGFTALPGGYRLILGSFRNMGNNTLFWSSTEDNSNNSFAWYRSLFNTSARINHLSDSKQIGMSVRCVRD